MNDDSLSEAGTMWRQNCCLCSLCLSEIKIIYIKRLPVTVPLLEDIPDGYIFLMDGQIFLMDVEVEFGGIKMISMPVQKDK